MRLHPPLLALMAFFLIPSSIVLAASSDPLLPYLDGKAPEIIREVTNSITPPEGVVLRQVVFRSRDNSEIYAAIASPMAAGKHPGILVLHGGGGSAEVEKAMSWAQRGFGSARYRRTEKTHGDERGLLILEIRRGTLGRQSRCQRERDL